MTLTLDYVLERRTAALVRRQAARVVNRCGLCAADRDDLAQELHLALLRQACRFDPARGQVQTFVATVIASRTQDFLNHRYAGRRDPHRCVPFTDTSVASADRCCAAAAQVELRLDVEHALSTMSPGARHVADGLQHGNVAEVARWLSLTRGQVRHQLALLRRRFEHLRLGFEGRAVA